MSGTAAGTQAPRSIQRSGNSWRSVFQAAGVHNNDYDEQAANDLPSTIEEPEFDDTKHEVSDDAATETLLAGGRLMDLAAEEAEAFPMAIRARRKVKTKVVRTRVSTAAASPSTDHVKEDKNNERSKRMTELKTKAKCHTCGWFGHWPRECPQRDSGRRGKSKGASPGPSRPIYFIVSDSGGAGCVALMTGKTKYIMDICEPMETNDPGSTRRGGNATP